MARNDPDEGAPILAAASVNTSEMRQIWTGATPTRCLIRIIDIEEFQTRDGPELRASFRDPGEAEKLPAGGIEQAIREAEVNATPKRKLASQVKRVIVGVVKALFTGAVLSPLDIALFGDPTIIVFFLARPANMRFSPLVKALTHKNPADRPGYGGLMHVTLTDGKYYESAEPLEDCRIVYFVCQPPLNPADPLPPPESYTYKHGLNLNVRLNHPTDADGTRRALDIMIDPDIRYPGQ